MALIGQAMVLTIYFSIVIECKVPKFSKYFQMWQNF